MSIELFLLIAFAIIGVLLAAWVTVLSCVIDELRHDRHNLKALLACKRKQGLAAKEEWVVDEHDRIINWLTRRTADELEVAAAEAITKLRAELAACGRDVERYRTALEQIVAPFEDLNFVSGNKLLTYIHDTATSALAADGVAEDV